MFTSFLQTIWPPLLSRPITGDVVLAGTTGMLQGAVLSLLILYSYGEKPKLLRHVVTKQAILMGFILLRDS